MTSQLCLVIFGYLMVAIVVQSIPTRLKPKGKILSSLTPSAKSTTPPSVDPIQLNIFKKKRSFNDPFDSDRNENDDVVSLHTKMRETPAQLPDNVQMNTDESKVLTDLRMNANELINLRRRRHSDQFNQRHKRALSSYESEPFYESLIDEQQQFLRPSRAFEPYYWYPFVGDRRARTTYSEPYEWNPMIENDDRVPLIFDDEDEYDRYPVLSDSSDIPYDNLHLQQEYNINDLPTDDDDDLLYNLYEPNDNSYFK